MSCGQIALRDMGITPEVYYASEVDKFASHRHRPTSPTPSNWAT